MTTFEIAKQAAAGGRLNFATVRGPLGDIVVRIEADSPERLRRFIDEVAPDTRSPTYRAGLPQRELKLLLKSERGEAVDEWTPRETSDGEASVNENEEDSENAFKKESEG